MTSHSGVWRSDALKYEQGVSYMSKQQSMYIFI